MKKSVVSRRKHLAKLRRFKLKESRERLALTLALSGLSLAIYEQSVEIDMIIDELEWEARHKEKVKREKRSDYNRAHYLLKKYESFWLHKLCRPRGHALPFRRVNTIIIKVYDSAKFMNNEEIHVLYMDGARHRVNEPGGGSGLPSEWAMEIKEEER